MSELKTVILNITDNSVKEYREEVIAYLTGFDSQMTTHAMSDYQLFLQGRKDMLEDIIQFIKNN